MLAAEDWCLIGFAACVSLYLWACGLIRDCSIALERQIFWGADRRPGTFVHNHRAELLSQLDSVIGLLRLIVLCLPRRARDRATRDAKNLKALGFWSNVEMARIQLQLVAPLCRCLRTTPCCRLNSLSTALHSKILACFSLTMAASVLCRRLSLYKLSWAEKTILGTLLPVTIFDCHEGCEQVTFLTFEWSRLSLRCFWRRSALPALWHRLTVRLWW